MLDGSRIVPSDILIGLPSNGLHTNGYSLARKVLLNKMQLDLLQKVGGLARPLGEELLRIHRNYQPLMASIPQGRIKGAAHITGGGLVDNLPRVLPATCDALDRHIFVEGPGDIRADPAWAAEFRLRRCTRFSTWGLGWSWWSRRSHASEVLSLTKGKVIGQITPGSGKVPSKAAQLRCGDSYWLEGAKFGG